MDQLFAWRPHSWLDYLRLYLVPGVFLGLYFLSKLIQSPPGEFSRDLIKAMGKERTLKQRIQDAAVYALAIFCLMVGWPGFLILLPFDYLKEKRNQAWQDRPDFDCAPEYLLEQITPAQAEALNIVYDPLGFAPEIAFGHLHGPWSKFVSSIQPDEELWSFLVPKGAKSGKYQFPAESEITGYARVKQGAVVEEFLY